jgi:Arc/MetJ-type ribon-helix-helix transcriptional regulator
LRWDKGCDVLDRIKRRKAVINCTVSPYIKDRIDEMVAYGMFSTISDAVAIALMELINRNEGELKALKSEHRESKMVVSTAETL